MLDKIREIVSVGMAKLTLLICPKNLKMDAKNQKLYLSVGGVIRDDPDGTIYVDSLNRRYEKKKGILYWGDDMLDFHWSVPGLRRL